MAYYNELNNYGKTIALLDENKNKVTYAEMNDFCKRMEKIIKKRTVVLSFCENSIGSICGYISFLYNGIVPVLLDKNIEYELRNNLIRIYQPEYLYIPDELIKEFKNLKCIWKEKGYCLYETDYKPKRNLYEQLALLLTTSGSTGSPKLVRQSYKNIQANAEAIAQYLHIDETERPITSLPMNYTYGLSIINSHLLKGATILVTKKTLMERDFWRFFKEEKATSFGGVPYTYEMLKKIRFFNMKMESLRYMTQAGGKLSPELHREYAQYAMKTGKKFIVMYGQCEATARMAYLPAEKSLEKYGSMGIAIPGGRLELVDIKGKTIEENNVIGELVYYGPNVTLGYAENSEDLEKGDCRNGRLETGDMAKRDSDEYFYIVGRKKRFLKLYGNRVNLDEIESMLKKYIKEGDCACAGVDDELYIFVTKYSEEIKIMIKKFLSEKTGINQMAFNIKYIEHIPKNEAGKTQYIKLKELYDGI